MRLLSKFFLTTLFLTVATVSWAACPEGQKWHDRQGECVPIPGWQPAGKHRIFSKLPCRFNGAEVTTSPTRAVNTSRRCCPNCKGYPRKRGVSLQSPRGTPVFAIADMRLLGAKNKNALTYPDHPWQSGRIRGKDSPYDDLELVFEDMNGNEIGYYHMLSTPFVPGFNKGKCMRPVCYQSSTHGRTAEKWKRYPDNCGGFSEELLKNDMSVKKGDLIGLSGTAGSASFSPHISLWVQMKDASGIYQYWAPEDTFEWENLPTESDAYLFPFMHQDYIDSLSEADQAWIKQEREWMETSESELIAAKTMSCDDTTTE